MNKELTLFTVTHKNFLFPQCSFIEPIQVNKQNTGLELGFINDNTGDNISTKNENYCELTALYWIWKNLPNIDANYIGLCHYRRYFTLPIKKNTFQKINELFHSKKQEDIFFKATNQETLNEVGGKNIEMKFIEILKENKVIVAKKASLKAEKKINFSIKTHYIYHHLIEDWQILEDVIFEKFPEYSDAIEFISAHNYMHCYNMFVSDKIFIENYCNWLFTILFEVEKRIIISKYPYQKRVIGFMAERLLNLYLHKNNIQKVEMPIVVFE